MAQSSADLDRGANLAVAQRFARGLLGCCAVGGGPTAEQRRVVAAAVLGFFGTRVDTDRLKPLAADELDLPDDANRLRFVEVCITLEFCRHPPDPRQSVLVEGYATALEVDLGLQKMARAYLESDLDRLMDDYHRHRGPFQEEIGQLALDDDELSHDLRALRHCAPGSLGRAFYDFHVDHGLRFAGEPGGGDRFLIPHDFAHVIADYPPTAAGEIAVNAFYCAATGGERYFGSLCSSLALHEGGLFRSRRGNTPTGGTLGREPGLSMFEDAVRRGVESGRDPMVLDHMALVDEPLDDVRRELRVRPRRDRGVGR